MSRRIVTNFRDSHEYRPGKTSQHQRHIDVSSNEGFFDWSQLSSPTSWICNSKSDSPPKSSGTNTIRVRTVETSSSSSDSSRSSSLSAQDKKERKNTIMNNIHSTPMTTSYQNTDSNIVAPNVDKLSPGSTVEIVIMSPSESTTILCSVDVLKMRSSFFQNLLHIQEDTSEVHPSDTIWRHAITVECPSPYEAAAFLECIHDNRNVLCGNWNLTWARLSVLWYVEDMQIEFSRIIQTSTSNILGSIRQNHWRTNPKIVEGCDVMVLRNKGTSGAYPRLQLGHVITPSTTTTYSRIRVAFEAENSLSEVHVAEQQVPVLSSSMLSATPLNKPSSNIDHSGMIVNKSNSISCNTLSARKLRSSLHEIRLSDTSVESNTSGIFLASETTPDIGVNDIRSYGTSAEINSFSVGHTGKAPTPSVSRENSDSSVHKVYLSSKFDPSKAQSTRDIETDPFYANFRQNRSHSTGKYSKLHNDISIGIEVKKSPTDKASNLSIETFKSNMPIITDASEPFWIKCEETNTWMECDDLSLETLRKIVSTEDKIMFWEMVSAILEFPEFATICENNQRGASFEISNAADLVKIMQSKENRILWIDSAVYSLPIEVTAGLIKSMYVLS